MAADRVVIEIALGGCTNLTRGPLGPHAPYVEFIYGNETFATKQLNEVMHITVELPKESASARRARLVMGAFEDEQTQMLVRVRESARMWGTDPLLGDVTLGVRGIQDADAGDGVGRLHAYDLVLDGEKMGVLNMAVRSIPWAACTSSAATGDDSRLFSLLGRSSLEPKIPRSEWILHTVKVKIDGVTDVNSSINAPLGLSRPYVEFVYMDDVRPTPARSEAHNPRVLLHINHSDGLWLALWWHSHGLWLAVRSDSHGLLLAVWSTGVAYSARRERRRSLHDVRRALHGHAPTTCSWAHEQRRRTGGVSRA